MKMKLTIVPEINMPMVRKVLTHVEEDLRRFNMNSWGTKLKSIAWTPWTPEEIQKHWAPCNTKACFAGWTRLLNVKRENWSTVFDSSGDMNDNTSDIARRLLGFTQREADVVFRADKGLTPKTQLRNVKKALNKIFEKRGMPDRV